MFAQTVVEIEDYNRFYDTTAGNSGDSYLIDDVDVDTASQINERRLDFKLI